MKLLLIGGPKFVGRHLIDAALARGHTLTFFNRGQTNAALYPEVEKLRGDRDGGLDALRGRTWDAVIDTCGYLPRLVRASAELLRDSAAHYTFISSISAYANTAVPGIAETHTLGVLADSTVEQVTDETYGPLKVLCEQAVEQFFPGRALHVRAGLIVGPHDPTDRFTYWPRRVARGGEVLAPGRPDYRVQFVDGRDLAAWIVGAVEAGRVGPFNATGPAQPLTMQQLFEACRTVSGSDARFTWADGQFIVAADVQPWTEMPLWIPDSDPDSGGFGAINCAKAIAAGLTFRPLPETVRDTLAWEATRPADYSWRAGISAERESELLKAWHAHHV
jgi:2'-hydroxyisoflavone reductase